MDQGEGMVTLTSDQPVAVGAATYGRVDAEARRRKPSESDKTRTPPAPTPEPAPDAKPDNEPPPF